MSYHGSKPLPSNSKVNVEETFTSGIRGKSSSLVLCFLTAQLHVEKHNKAKTRVSNFAIKRKIWTVYTLLQQIYITDTCTQGVEC